MTKETKELLASMTLGLAAGAGLIWFGFATTASAGLASSFMVLLLLVWWAA